MKRIKRSPLVKVDLLEIWLHIAEHNISAADRVVAAIEEKIQYLAEWPGVGSRRDDLAADLRGFPIGSYVIFYRPWRNSIEVVRVVHGARNLPTLFQS